MAGSGLTKSKGGGVQKGGPVGNGGGLARSNSAPGGLAKAPTMTNRQYMAARAKADIAKVQRAINSPTGKKVQAAAVGFGKGFAKASKGAISAGKAARALADKLR